MGTERIQGAIRRPKYSILGLSVLLVLTQFILLILLAVPFSAFAADPVISPNPAVAVFVTGAYVAWNTNIASNSRVDYGTTTSYGSYVNNVSNVTHHVLTITGLSANTTYHYKVTSGATVSSDFTFTTYANPTGTVRTVGSGKTHPTIQACSDAASAGDTCLVYAGSYSSVTPRSGSAGAGYFTILAQEAATVAGFDVSGKAYVAIKGFEIPSADVDAASAANHITIENNYIHNSPGSCIQPTDHASSTNNTWWVIKNNILWACGYSAINLSGSNNLIDGNDIGGLTLNDWMYDIALTTSVIRNNVAHDATGNSGNHTDFIQWDAGTGSLTLKYTLVENNTVMRCVDSSGNCHFLISRGDESAPQNLIIRYNYLSQWDGSGILLGTNENNLAQRIYNNTFALGNKSEDNVFSSYYANYTKSLNNLAYDTCGTSENCFDTGTGIVNNYNVQRDSVNANATWGSDYQNEATYATLKNLAPSFTNYPYEKTISSSSALIDKGGNLTTVTSGCGTSTLTLADVRWFQPGWAGTQADWLAIGTTVSGAITRQVTGVNYSGTASTSSGTVTFAASVGCTNGDKVWLYKKSDGVQVLYGTAPDIGAYEYAGGHSPLPPTNLRLISQ